MRGAGRDIPGADNTADHGSTSSDIVTASNAVGEITSAETVETDASVAGEDNSVLLTTS